MLVPLGEDDKEKRNAGRGLGKWMREGDWEKGSGKGTGKRDAGRGLGKGMQGGEWDDDVGGGENKCDFSCCQKDTSSALWIVSGNLFHRADIAFWNDLAPECVSFKKSQGIWGDFLY